MVKSAIVISASSDIGAALCKDWRKKGWEVAGTYRTPSPLVSSLDVELHQCDLLNPSSIDAACKLLPPWDVLIFAPGLMEPIGHFEEVDFAKWEEGIQVNFLGPMRMLHALLAKRKESATVLFFAGGGTNNAVTRYSSYTVSKIALIKMCELLDAEIEDTRFVIVGPGWVNTKIHESTLRAGASAGANFQKTQERQEWVTLEEVVECCNYFIETPCQEVSGRNFSLVFDQWGTSALEAALKEDSHMYKLRRCKNEWG